MRKSSYLITIFIVFFLAGIFFPDRAALGAHWAGELSGYILLQVEQNGEAWYVFPGTGKRYYLGSPSAAFELMKKFGLGAKHSFIADNEIYPQRYWGEIIIDVEQDGRAYYIYPKDRKKYYLGRPADAFRIMGRFGRGITDADLVNIPEGQLDEEPATIELDKKSLLNVLFTSQAPFGIWTDKRLQDGCEEASALMAMKWVKGETLTKSEAEKTIIGMSDFLLKKYGEFRDVSPADMVKWIFNDYYGYKNIFLVRDVTINDMISELNHGHLIITPMNGQIMHNPYYRSPGPPRHMIVIKGYDPATKEFITNDPGTRNGESYRYDAKVLFEAIRDYPTGYQEIIYRIEKTMILVDR